MDSDKPSFEENCPEGKTPGKKRVIRKGILAGGAYSLFWFVFTVFRMSTVTDSFGFIHSLPHSFYQAIIQFCLPILAAAAVTLILFWKGAGQWYKSLGIALIIWVAFDLFLHDCVLPLVNYRSSLQVYLPISVFVGLYWLLFTGIAMGIAAVLIRCFRKGR